MENHSVAKTGQYVNIGDHNQVLNGLLVELQIQREAIDGLLAEVDRVENELKVANMKIGSLHVDLANLQPPHCPKCGVRLALKHGEYLVHVDAEGHRIMPKCKVDHYRVVPVEAESPMADQLKEAETKGVK
jgi:hypothetical protein